MSLEQLGVGIELIEVDGAEQFDERRWLNKATARKLLAADQVQGPLIWLDSDLVLLSSRDAFTYATYEKPLVAALQRPHIEGDAEFNPGLLYWPSAVRLSWNDTIESCTSDRHSSDQVVFNLASKTHVNHLSNEYNFVWGLFVTHPPMKMPKVTHYGGMSKPWHLPMRSWFWCEQHMCVWEP